MTLEHFLQSKTFRAVVIGIGLTLVVLVSFTAGVSVGLHKARFSYAWGENYEKRFLGGGSHRSAQGMMGVQDGRGFRNPHGTAGTVIGVSDDVLIIQDRDQQESSVRMTDQTVILKQREKIARGDIKTGEGVVVVGKPAEDGVVNADFVRVFESERASQ